MDRKEIRKLVEKLTLEEKAGLCSGAEMFCTKGVERLGIPAFNLSDGPHGLRKQSGKQDFMGQNQSVTATCFPAACATGSSFDTELVKEMAHMLGRQWQSENEQILLGPGINIKRSPLCGRNFEYFSEDPLVSGTLGSAYVEGVQEEGIGTCLKHFLANNQECRRRTQSSNMDERTLREIYTPAFEQVIKEAKPWSVMASYNKLDGVYATESGKYLNDLLRSEWGFDGAVISDWAAVHDRVEVVKGGCDLTMPGEPQTDHLLVEAVQNGTLEKEVLNRCCENMIALAFRAQEEKRSDVTYDFEEAHELARHIAANSMVLLKNEDDLLPLDAAKKIAFIGKFAEEPRYQGAGSSRVNPYQVKNMLEVTAGMDHITYTKGFDLGASVDEAEQAKAVEAAKNADIAVIFAGLPPVMESEGYDRWTMKLPVCQNELIEAVCSVQPNTVVVLQNGGAVEMPWTDKPKAILEAYLGGEAVCEAIWDVLTGVVNPSGRLAETFPKRLQDNPCYLFWPGEADRVEYREGVFVGYRYYTSRDMEVRYPFGYGLSYTTFAYGDLRVSSDTFTAGDTLKVRVDVTNTGDRAGSEVVQLYIGAALGSIDLRRPVRELRGFQKVRLEAGETKTVEFSLDKRAFAHWELEAHAWRVAGGEYEIQIGRNANDIVLSRKVKAQNEFLPTGIHYSIMTPICDVESNPVGKAFWDRIMPMVNAIIARMNAGAPQAEMPYADEVPKSVGLMVEPLQTLKRMVPNISEEEWDRLFAEMNALNS